MLPDAIKDEPLVQAIASFRADSIVGGHKQHGDLTIEVAPADRKSVV